MLIKKVKREKMNNFIIASILLNLFSLCLYMSLHVKIFGKRNIIIRIIKEIPRCLGYLNKIKIIQYKQYRGKKHYLLTFHKESESYISFYTLDEINDEICKKKSVSEIYIIEKIRECNYIIILMFCVSFLYYLLYFFKILNFNSVFILCLFVNILTCIITIYLYLINYRNKLGYFGNNYDEAKELLYFIKMIKDDSDINKGKKIFNENYETIYDTRNLNVLTEGQE